MFGDSKVSVSQMFELTFYARYTSNFNFYSLHRQLSPTCQMILVSTTYDCSSMKIAESITRNPIMLTLLPEQQSLDSITQFYVRCDSQEDKYQAIRNIYELLCSMNANNNRRPLAQAFTFCNVRMKKCV